MTPVTITITENGDQLVIDVDHGRETDDLKNSPSAADQAAAVMIALFNHAMDGEPDLIAVGNQAVFNA